MTLEMNPEIRARWTAALRSGDYKRSSGVLRAANDRFCCLGVLCDLAEKAGVVSGTQAGPFAQWRYDDESAYLPRSIQAWAGLTRQNPQVEDGGLANLNDDGWSFAQIADAIDGGTS